MSKNNSFLDRRALFASGAAAALLAAAGVSAGGLPQRGGKLRLAASGAARSDSWTSGDGLFMQLATQGVVFDTLVELCANGTLRGELATGWTVRHGGREWALDLRKNVVFHDGSPFGARDVVASLSRSLPLADVRADGPDRVILTLDMPDPSLPFTLAGPAHVIRAAHAMEDGIGTGLYRVQRFVPGQHLLAERVPADYRDGQAGWFDRVELVSIPSESVRAQALAEYLVDAADMQNGAALKASGDVAILPAMAASRSLGMGQTVSATRPFDNLRAAERWWFV